MSIISRMRRQTCVYWAKEGYDNYGKPLTDPPIQLTCRWQDMNEEFIDSEGTRQMSRAKVFVDQDVDVGGVLMLGVLGDVTDALVPKNNAGAWEIKRFDNMPNLKATEYLKTAYV